MMTDSSILHYTDDRSDKVYIVEMHENNGSYSVVTIWGRRTAPVLTFRTTSFATRLRAKIYANKIVREKENKGYNPARKNLQIQGYHPEVESKPRTTVKPQMIKKEEDYRRIDL